MAKKLKKKLQADQFAEKLKEIAGDVAESDKADCRDELGLTQPTVWRYLNGQGKDPGTAHRIYIFFKTRIDARSAALA